MLLPLLGLLAANTPFDEFAAHLRAHQSRMVEQLTKVDPGLTWTKDEHARGCAMVLSDGDVWEKGCVSITVVEDGVLTKDRAAAISARTDASGIEEGSAYAAAALSFVLHARSPLVPTLRGDVRVFAVAGSEARKDEMRQKLSSLKGLAKLHRGLWHQGAAA